MSELRMIEAELAVAQARIAELVPQCDATYAPYREMVQKARAEVNKFSTALVATEKERDDLNIRLIAAVGDIARLTKVLTDILNDISSSHLGSIGALHNTYICQIEVEAVSKWRGVLRMPSEGGAK